MKSKTITGNTVIIETIRSRDTTLAYRIKQDAMLTIVVLVSGNTNCAIDVGVHLVGKNSRATIIGLVRGSDDAQITFHTMQHHAAIGTTSNLLVKSILSDRSVFSYDGSIFVDQIAQKTDAYQRNENLLLDKTTRARSEPALEILANDVRCTHGATIGMIDKEELWYLATRGIADARAREMIATGFLQSAFSLIPDTMTREKIERKCVLP
jgi:Fe-S cluster assembly protein SufD